ncbi:MAG: tRNA pseudouridine synthase [Bacteroidetes bacterium]|nr:tRNA pseudouridine synthase [Bacteroidota bacterium]
MENIKLLLEYDGTNYVGWQVQPNGPSVQAELEKALGQILQQPAVTVAAGRTDAGVHARGQVVSFKILKSVQLPQLLKSLNALLPADIVVISIESVPSDFHARYSALYRVYRYYLSFRPTAIQRNYSWYVGGYDIDRKLLDACASSVIGEWDFSSFCKRDTNVDHFRCTVGKSEWTQNAPGIVYEIRSNRFLYGMVRALVGTMVEVARGHREYKEFAEILIAKDRERAGMAAPARGLFLEEVVY